MSDPDRDHGAGRAEKTEANKSFGNISEHHWSRARAGTNEEALEYYRARSHAPGVESGGASRNYYCMKCDGVIAFDCAEQTCPHCGASLAGQSKRYFNWVEINEPAASDFKALLPFLIAGALVLLAIAGLVVWFFARKGDA